jgi:hypothetical protein
LIVDTKSYYGTSPTDTAGAARYKIVTAAEYGGTPDEYGDHTLANGNVALLQHDNTIKLAQFGVIADGVTIESDAVQAAIDYVAALTGKQHDTNYAGSNPEPPAFYQQYGAVRVLEWVPKKVLVDRTIILKNSVSVVGNNGGLLADVSFTTNDYILDLDNTPYSGRVKDFTVDGQDHAVKGIRVRSAAYSYWQNITVTSCENTAFTHLDGPECVVDGLHIICSSTPVSRNVRGLEVFGSDSYFSNVVVRFAPIGVYVEGGNNEFVKVHPWGLYSNQLMYVCFWDKGTGNKYSHCYADSPTKSFYDDDNYTTQPDGFINGGIAFYLEDARDAVIADTCHVFVNETEYINAGNPVSENLLMVGLTGNQRNVIAGLTERPGSGIYFSTFRYESDALKELTSIQNAPKSEPNRTRKNTFSQANYTANGFAINQQDLGNVSGNWGLDLNNGTYVKLNTTGGTTLNISNFPSADTGDQSGRFVLFVTGTNAPSFFKNIRTPDNAGLPNPSVRGLYLECIFEPVSDIIIIYVVANL